MLDLFLSAGTQPATTWYDNSHVQGDKPSKSPQCDIPSPTWFTTLPPLPKEMRHARCQTHDPQGEVSFTEQRADKTTQTPRIRPRAKREVCQNSFNSSDESQELITQRPKPKFHLRSKTASSSSTTAAKLRGKFADTARRSMNTAEYSRAHIAAESLCAPTHKLLRLRSPVHEYRNLWRQLNDSKRVHAYEAPAKTTLEFHAALEGENTRRRIEDSEALDTAVLHSKRLAPTSHHLEQFPSKVKPRAKHSKDIRELFINERERRNMILHNEIENSQNLRKSCTKPPPLRRATIQQAILPFEDSPRNWHSWRNVRQAPAFKT